MRFLLLAALFASALPARPPDWQLGVQAYTFRTVTVAETLAKSAALDLRVIELYPGQKLGGDLAGNSNYTMDAATRQGLKALLRAHRIHVAAYGCCTPGQPEDWRRLFEFARDMGIPTIVSEPNAEQLDMVEQLADEFGIRVALHNHAHPSRYWDPASVLAATKGRSARLGACADVGHWLRSGLDPVTCLRQLQGRLVSIHLKDMTAKAKSAHCVPFGTGALDLSGVLAELKRQRFAGLFSIEYEHDADHPYPAVRQCVVWFRQAAKLSEQGLLAGRAPKGAFTMDVAEVWAAPEPGYRALWPEIARVNTDGYRDATDGVKTELRANGYGFPNEHYSNVFDNDPKTKWCIKTQTTWIECHFPEGTRPAICAYTITSANDAPDRDPKQWRLFGSNDGGATWESVDERENQKWSARFQKRLFELAGDASYQAYRLETKNSGNPDTSQLAEIELLVRKDEK